MMNDCGVTTNICTFICSRRHMNILPINKNALIRYTALDISRCKSGLRDYIKYSAIRYLKSHILQWGKMNRFDYPWRTTKNLWHGIVAEIMLQRTKTDQVIPVYKDFARRFPTPKDYIEYSKNTNENIFDKLGLKWRDVAFRQLSNKIVEEGIPEYKTDLMKLPGIGDYVSSAYLSFHLNKREILIDSNIVRFYGRFFGFKTGKESRRDKKIISLANEVTPTRNVKDFNYAVLDFAMKVCKPKPACFICLLKRKCNYYQKVIK